MWYCKDCNNLYQTQYTLINNKFVNVCRFHNRNLEMVFFKLSFLERKDAQKYFETFLTRTAKMSFISLSSLTAQRLLELKDILEM